MKTPQASSSVLKHRPISAKKGSSPLRAKSSSQLNQSTRLNVYLLIRILFQYLERCGDKSTLDLAREVLKDCERKQNLHDSKYKTLCEAVNERVRDVVGEQHWMKARKIQKQLMANQQRKKIMALKAQAAKK